MSETDQTQESSCRDTLIFDIHYNYYMNKMTSLLLGRVDRFLSFIVVFLGGAVFADVKNTMWYGLLIALSMALKQVFQFSESSARADSQCKAFLRLIRDESHINCDLELTKQIQDVEKNDIHHLKAIEFAAMQRATIVLSADVEPDSAVSLSILQKLVAWFAGDLPEEKDYKSFIKN
ncbi:MULTISPECIES: hypothetical protein [unclassified Gilliamella]|uniref:hypothetical protein n=1 Tax=unclassified Gilliamella TaxID=2685620 RepID=UPI001306C304|nr:MULTISPECIES: hypothetical protein [unclassified Gilliamella]MWP48569.1 hypothetical protein [Gilliamella sp. Lep-s35]MWP68631.1 hypothetical protein [Gilliamella sp. Lep-s5]MWP76701.1 hypothetical protein [Gilliamella sp. Lep-s21]